MAATWKIIEFTGRGEWGVSISIAPEVTDSRPARMRNSVVLPHPLGPTIMKNSPGAMSSETPSIAMSCPNILRRSRMRMAGRVGSGSAASSLASGRIMDGPGRSICRAKPAFTTAYFAPIGRGHRPLLEAQRHVERRAGTMKRSSDRILTTHVGSLIRPQPLQAFLRAKQAGEAFDAKAYETCLTQSVGAIVHRQAEAGTDVVSDGEFGKSISWSQYALERLSGFERRPIKPGANPFQRGADRERFAEFYAELDAREEVATRMDSVCVGPIAYTGQAELERDIHNFKAALEGVKAEEAFLPVAAPASVIPD